MAFLVATTSLPAVYRRTATPERRPLERRTLVPIVDEILDGQVGERIDE